MGDRHGGRFARRGRTLSPPRRGFPTARCGFPMARGGGQDLPPRENTPLGEGLPTRRTSEGICPTQKHAPRRKPPDTAHERKDLPPREKALLNKSLPTRRTSEKICPAQEHAPRRRPPDTAHERKDLPRGVRPRPTCRRTAGRPRPTNSRKNTPSAGSHPRRGGRCRVHSPKKNKTTP